MSSLFCDIVGRRLQLSWWRFGTTYWSRYVVFQNVGEQLPIYNVQPPRRAKTLTAPQR